MILGIANKVLMATLVFIVFALASIAYSYGQVATFQTSKTEKVYLQLQLRNSDGKLVAYIEPTDLQVFHPDLVDQYLDEKPNKSIVIIGGERFEKVQFTEHQTFTNYHVMAGYIWGVERNGEIVNLLAFWHDGYPMMPGDTLEASFTFLRPDG